MHDALLVRGLERVGDLLGDRQRLVEWNRAAPNPLREILAVDEFHHERRDVPALLESVDARNVWMIQRGESLGFPLEPREPIGVVCERLGQNLDRNVAIQFGIARAIHLTHPAFTDLGGDLVDAETRAGSKGQTAGSIAVTRRADAINPV